MVCIRCWGGEQSSTGILSGPTGTFGHLRSVTDEQPVCWSRRNLKSVSGCQAVWLSGSASRTLRPSSASASFANLGSFQAAVPSAKHYKSNAGLIKTDRYAHPDPLRYEVCCCSCRNELTFSYSVSLILSLLLCLSPVLSVQRQMRPPN